ncbi:hypothetical protein FB384_004953 [Prauserella sediminis]|uniref:Uncharacterized protein n=1 Tax=Prauserella sediminis TaxID=577680 RepID=A0A839XXB2_9PSEU|nr:hypothetical protein [Prauserella sediminis]MBB3665994.1 hypothetical protein [Prauserella sediminis]
MAADRKPSPLATGRSWRDDPETPATAPLPEPAPAQQAQQEPEPAEQPPTSGDAENVLRFPRRRKRTNKKLDPFEWRSFNCNMPVVLKRIVRTYAAQNDMDIQDVVAQALVNFFDGEGVTVPQTQEEYDAMLKDGRLL